MPMPELLQIQKSFYKSIFQEETPALDFISSGLAEERFNIYRQTIFENMRNALEITFPGIWKLIGDSCASGIACSFFKSSENLPKTGCLDDFGETFPVFLGSLEKLGSVPYLQDYALYEWLTYKSYGARDSKSIIASDLQNIAEEHIDHVKFLLSPSCFLFSSIYPIADIHALIENYDNEPITLSKQSSYGVIVRLEGEVNTLWVTKDMWTFLSCISRGLTLAQSVAQVQQHSSTFDLTNALCFMLKKQLINVITH